MKKIIKWLAIVLLIVLVLLLVGLAALPFVFPPDKIKDLAATKLSEILQREVVIRRASFDFFSGFKLEECAVGNAPSFSRQPFMTAERVELRYAFWPLFSRQIIIKEIRLVRPTVLIEKNQKGEFNFPSFFASGKKSAARSSALPAGLPFTLLVSRFSVIDGTIVYKDPSSPLPVEMKNISAGISGFGLALLQPIDFTLSSSVFYQRKTIPLKLSGKMGINLLREELNFPFLSLSLAGENLDAVLAVSGWRANPSVSFILNTNRLALDPFLALLASPNKPTKKPTPGELTKAVNQLTKALPANLAVHGKISAANLSLQQFKVDKLSASLVLSRKLLSFNVKELALYNGALSGQAIIDLQVSGLAYQLNNLKLAHFDAHPFSDVMVASFLTFLPDYRDLLGKVYGRADLSGSLRGRGVESASLFPNLSGSLDFSLKDGELKRLKTLAAIGQLLNSNTLQDDIKFGHLSGSLAIDKNIVRVKGFKLDKPELNLGFTGGLDLNMFSWVPGNRLSLSLSPLLTKDAPKELVFLKDNRGWLNLTFEISGSLDKPVPHPLIDKPVEAIVGNLKIMVDAKKIEIERNIKDQAATQEAQLKESVKKQLKDLLNF